MMKPSLTAAEHAELVAAAASGSTCAKAVLADAAGQVLDEDQHAWVAYFTVSRSRGGVDLNRTLVPHLAECPACGSGTYVELHFGIGETTSMSAGPRNALGHAGDEHHAWVLNMVCSRCGHEGELLIDTGDPLYEG